MEHVNNNIILESSSVMLSLESDSSSLINDGIEACDDTDDISFSSLLLLLLLLFAFSLLFETFSSDMV